MIEGTEAGKCFTLGQVTEAEETQKGGISPHPTGTERRRGGGRRRRCPAPTPQTKCVTPQMVHDDAPDGAPAPRGWPVLGVPVPGGPPGLRRGPGAPQRPAAGAQERAILGRPRLPLLSAPTASHSGYLRAAGRGRVWSEEVPRTAGHLTGGFPAGAGGRSRDGRSGQGQVHPRRVARAAESHRLPRPACTGDGTDSGGFEFLESG